MGKTKIERIDADGRIIAMTDEELDALDAKRRKLLLVVGAVGLAVAIIAVLALSMFLKVGVGSRSALADVTTFSKGVPVQINADTLEYRLDQASGFDWGLTSWGRDFGKGDVDGSLEQGMDQIAGEATLPTDARITTIYTNLGDEASVRLNGRLLIVRFELPAKASDFLLSEPTVFEDSSVEKLRDTYWSGAATVFYSPAGAEEDRTYQIRKFLPEFASCPKNTATCEASPEFVRFDAWAPRAPLSKD